MRNLILTLALFSIPPALATNLADADAAFQKQQWKQAAAAYELLTRSDESDGRSWLRLGLARKNLGDLDQAIQALETADGLGFAPAFTGSKLAAAYAEAGKPDRAFRKLEGAIRAGFSDIAGLRTDAEFERLRADDRFSDAVRKTDRNARPCEYDEHYRQFDFWIGDWDVFTAQGIQAGTNRVTRSQKGCLILEEWTSARGGSGQSMNYFDPEKKSWNQLWVDAGGGLISASGGLRDGSMHLVGENISRDGTKELNRGTWTPLADGRVRQFFEQSKDGGKSWYTWFEGFYVRKTGEPAR